MVIYLPCIPFISSKFPVSSNLRLVWFLELSLLSVPNIFPKTGIKIRAIKSDEESIARRVTGRKNINSPAIPGQKIKGKKAASVVDVDATTGINIFFC